MSEARKFAATPYEKALELGGIVPGSNAQAVRDRYIPTPEFERGPHGGIELKQSQERDDDRILKGALQSPTFRKLKRSRNVLGRILNWLRF